MYVGIGEYSLYIYLHIYARVLCNAGADHYEAFKRKVKVEEGRLNRYTTCMYICMHVLEIGMHACMYVMSIFNKCMRACFLKVCMYIRIHVCYSPFYLIVDCVDVLHCAVVLMCTCTPQRSIHQCSVVH